MSLPRTARWRLPIRLWGLAMDPVDRIDPGSSYLPLRDCHAGLVPEVRTKATEMRVLS